MTKDNFGLKDRVDIIAHDSNGNVIYEATPYEDACLFSKILGFLGITKFTHDYISDVGLQDVVTYLHDNYIYLGVGTDGTGPVDTSRTELGAEYKRSVATSVEYSTITSTNDAIVITATFNMTSAETLAETGVFNALTGGKMLARQTFDGLPLSIDNVITVVWTIQFTR